MNILFLSPENLYPPHSGHHLRSLNVLKLLAREHRIFFIGFYQHREEYDYLPALRQHCVSAELFPIPATGYNLRFLLAALRNLFSPHPLVAQRYYRRPAAAQMRRLVREAAIDLVHIDMLALGLYLRDLPQIPVFLTNHNVESLRLERRQRTEKNPFLRLYLYYQARKLRRFEARCCAAVNRCIAVSRVDSAILREIAPEGHFSVVPNGVDTDYFRPVVDDGARPGRSRPLPESAGAGGLRPPDNAVPGGLHPPDNAAPGGLRPPDNGAPGGLRPPDNAVPGGLHPPDNGAPGGLHPPENIAPAGLRAVPATKAVVENDGRNARLVWVGGMESPYNADAVDWFLEKIWPLIAVANPLAEAWFIGSAPTARLRAVAAAGRRIHATGFVEDIRPLVAEAAIFIAPLRSGSGTKVKVLNAMAQGKAVVATPVAAEGIEAVNGRHFLVAAEPAAFAETVLRLLARPAEADKLGRAARALIEQRYSWEVIAKEMLRIYEDNNNALKVYSKSMV